MYLDIKGAILEPERERVFDLRGAGGQERSHPSEINVPSDQPLTSVWLEHHPIPFAISLEVCLTRTLVAEDR